MSDSHHQTKISPANLRANFFSAAFLPVAIFLVPSFAIAQSSTDQLSSFDDLISLESLSPAAVEDVSRSNLRSDKEFSFISQIGNNNSASISQSRGATHTASANAAYVYQNGDSLEANIIQTGSGNAGLIAQIGSQHRATIEQRGVRHNAGIIQSGSNSDITISQSGTAARSLRIEQRSNSGAAMPIRINMY